MKKNLNPVLVVEGNIQPKDEEKLDVILSLPLVFKIPVVLWNRIKLS